LWAEKYREPDILFLRPKRMSDLHSQPQGADLVVEVLSEGEANRRRDLVDKRHDYVRAGVSEYWIVDPEQRAIEVLTLDGAAYRNHGLFRETEAATSVLLPGFSVVVADVFAAAEPRPETET
jgi:Uma2 family endonuclease